MMLFAVIKALDGPSFFISSPDLSSQQDARVIREQALAGGLFTALLNHLTKADAQQALMHAAS
jgi:hypothetical protein